MNDSRCKDVFHAILAEDLKEVIPGESFQQADNEFFPIEGACLPALSHEHIIRLCRIDEVIPEERFQLALYRGKVFKFG